MMDKRCAANERGVVVMLLLVLVSKLTQVVGAGGHHWTYKGKEGPAHWSSIEKSSCGGESQSPIDLGGKEIQSTSTPPFVFDQYDVAPNALRMENNGHSVSISIDDSGVKPTVSGGGLEGTYNFHSLHFHWGADSKRGSEHTFYGRRFPIEMHLVHFNAKFANLPEAVASKEPNALAVLGVMFYVDPNGATDLKPIVNQLASVRHEGESFSLDGGLSFPLASLLPPNTRSFFRYSGSLTTPACNEVVIWTVFEWTKPISEKQLHSFRSLLFTARGEPDKKMVDNFRPVQPLNGRSVGDVAAAPA